MIRMIEDGFCKLLLWEYGFCKVMLQDQEKVSTQLECKITMLHKQNLMQKYFTITI